MQTGNVTRMSLATPALADSTSAAERDPSVAVSVANLLRVKNEFAGFFSPFFLVVYVL